MHVVRWSGQSGQAYDFRLFEIDDALAAESGVYVFTKLQDNGKWGAIYFGETGDLSERFDHHHAMPCITEHAPTHIGIHTDGMFIEEARKAVESDLLERYPLSFTHIPHA